MSGSIIGQLADSIRAQTAGRELRYQAGVDLTWAQRIVDQHAAGTFRGGVHAVKEAQKVLDDRAELERMRSGDAA